MNATANKSRIHLVYLIMTKSEAAAALGVSVRTVERLCSAGKLTKGREKAKTRPRVVFERAQVEALKVELESTETEVFRRLNTEKPKETVAFRMDPFYLARLSEEGASRGLSGQQYARKLVIQGLEDSRIGGAQQEIESLKRGLADLFYTILVASCGASEREAEEFVNRALLSA